jgi:predicted ATPase
MKIELKNFGPILYFEFDLEKDLHIIYGENNVGKSYAIAVVYLIIKNLKTSFSTLTYFRHFSYSRETSAISELADFIYRQRNSGKKKKDEIDISDKFNNFLKKIFEEIFVQALRTSIENSFSDVNNKFNKKEKTEVILSFPKFKIALSLLDEKWVVSEFNYDIPVFVKYIEKGDVDNQSQAERQKYIYVKRTYTRLEAVKEELSNKLTISFEGILYEIWNHAKSIHFLPASRSGLYQGLTALPPILAKLSQVRYTLGGNSLEIPALPEPVSDYFLTLSNVRTSKEETIYTQLAKLIEQDVLGAEIVFNGESSKIEYHNRGINLKLDLSETSSMISEVAPIVAYLKFIINNSRTADFFPFLHRRINEKSSHLMFIEEPEAHLHPKMQVKMMEVFAAMVNENIKIVMTTHSDFLKDKLTNLLLSKALSPKQVASYHFVMGEQGSYDAGDMRATEDGIEDHNFASVAEALYEERLKIYESLNETNVTSKN